MSQKEIVKYYQDNGGLRCKYWSVKEIREYIKSDLGQEQMVGTRTCLLLKNIANYYQR